MTVTVTDHAVIRWLERVQGMDIEAVRNLIAAKCASAEAAAAAAGLPGRHVIRTADACYVLDAGTVITVVYRKGRLSEHSQFRETAP